MSFLGYEDLTSQVLAIYDGSSFQQSCTGESRFGIILNQTNFYAEQGGQECDFGSITIDGQAEFVVDDVQVYGGYILHVGHFKYGSLNKGDSVICSYDSVKITLVFNHYITSPNIYS
jgi:alanyl-tRNA synthetase